MMATAKADNFTARMFDAINGMMLNVLAAVARKDYEDRRRRQAQGQAKAKAEGRYKGSKENVARNDGNRLDAEGRCLMVADSSRDRMQSGDHREDCEACWAGYPHGWRRLMARL